MTRTIYTEVDIEDLKRRGVTEITIDENTYLTDLAREKMEQLGIRAKTVSSAAPTNLGPSGGGLSDSEKQQVFEKVKSGVIARLGPGVDEAMVDTIVRRVVNQL